QDVDKNINIFTLDNGMTFIVVPRPEIPIFSGVIVFKVGGVDEHLGITGISHMIEHMMFKGTPVIGTMNWKKEKRIIDDIETIGRELASLFGQTSKEALNRKEELEKKLKDLQNEEKKLIIDREWDMIYSRAGEIEKNAWTSKSNTTYYISLPSNKLELWFLMESERFINPSFREFYQERDVVTEEYRTGQNHGDNKLYNAVLGVSFLQHPQRYPVIGFYGDIRTYTLKKVWEYFSIYYIPNNAVAAIVGDVDVGEVKSLAEKYFGRWKKGKQIPPVWSGELPQEGERKVTVWHWNNPTLVISYHMPSEPRYTPEGNEEAYVLSIISDILANGKTSRLYRNLVLDKKLATGVYADTGDPGPRGPGLFTIEAIPFQEVDLEMLEREIYSELEKLKSESVSADELKKVLTLIKASMVWKWKDNTWLAMSLALSQINTGNWNYDREKLNYYEKITPEDIKRIAKKYFTAENRIVGYLRQDKNRKPVKVNKDLLEKSRPHPQKGEK
ncbi:MAG: insulinase family protein, partial [Candidatus Coatesbacteria bacterium]|nr:insulinase family protein [Candidatus Coatesbacteria bacterium]